jgi:predicted sugar kinase
MFIEIGVPSSLPLGLVKAKSENGTKTAILGLTLQHPPVNLFAQMDRRLNITGARADVGHDYAHRFFKRHNLKKRALVEIELSVPAFVGLNSRPLLGLGMAQALSWVHGLPHETADSLQFAQAIQLSSREALPYWSFTRGGLLLVDTEAEPGQMPDVLMRQRIEHEMEKDAWAFVFHFPRIPKGTKETLEADRLLALIEAAPHLSEKSGPLVQKDLKTAIRENDIVAFGQAIMLLQRMNQEALAAAGQANESGQEDQAVLELIQAHGALAWGKSPTGLSTFGLIKGGQASRVLRKAILDQVGYFGGIVMASITDNVGGRFTVKEGDLNDKRMSPIRQRPVK